jgi:hypothetical protein
MRTQYLTIEQLKQIKVITVEQGKQLASDILEEQLSLHRQMQGLTDNKLWHELSDRHFYLRKIRQSILHSTGLMAIAQKRAAKR